MESPSLATLAWAVNVLEPGGEQGVLAAGLKVLAVPRPHGFGECGADTAMVAPVSRGGRLREAATGLCGSTG
ncbi:hypothetical protein Y717_20550 [Streptomyces scopuliridis RB72]|uniref:Uncharacterized protein n=1 Tax=Streptomyces scopuliridis RB72 TaxID=1440053 RepID=A0A2T7TDP0_9ACTN|nr:hypothetical protein Y717_20550 [Streptomyces scopuliridis RB72]